MQHFFSKKQWAAVGIMSIVVAAAFTSIGYKLGSRSNGSFGPMNGQFQGRGGMMSGQGRMGMRGNGNVAGTVINQDTSTITLSLPQGGSRTVLITPTTTVLKTAPGSITDIQKDSFVMVSGTANADGSISATTLSLRPTPAQKSPNPQQ